jgi:hypothetical protein
MAKIPRNYRMSEEADALIKAEAERLTGATGKRVYEVDVIEMAVVRWCSDDGDGQANIQQNEGPLDVAGRRAAAEAAIRGAEAGSVPGATVAKLNRGAESVAQRRAREAREHAAELAESDVLAKMTGREDIDYDLENVPHRSVLGGTVPGSRPEPVHYEVQPRKVKTLARPHGATEPKRRREQ